MRKALPLLVVCLLSIAAVAADAQTSTTHSASLTWGAITNSGATYTVLRGNVPGGPKTAIASGLTSASYNDQNLAANSQYCYQITAQVPGLADSDPNAEACGTTAQDKAPTPGPIILIIH